MAEKVPPAATSHGMSPVDYHAVDRGRRLAWRLASRSRDRITDYSGWTQYDRVSVRLGSAARTRRTNEFGCEQQRVASRLAQTNIRQGPRQSPVHSIKAGPPPYSLSPHNHHLHQPSPASVALSINIKLVLRIAHHAHHHLRYPLRLAHHPEQGG